MMLQRTLLPVRMSVTMNRIERRRRNRGVTLIEILIVLAIIGLISGGVALVAVPKFQEAQVTTAKNDTKQIYTIAENWRATHGTDCPTVERLKADREISATSNTVDPWGMSYKINCEDADTIQIVSFGRDKKENTADDIKMPPEGR